MKKDFIVSKIEALQDGSQYVLVALPIVMSLGQQVKVVKQYHLPLQKT
jgi:hypothetical protein